MNQPSLIELPQGPTAYCTSAGQFTGVAIVNYCVWQSNNFDYTLSGITDYCHSILEMSNRGWPGGFRWLHGENLIGWKQVKIDRCRSSSMGLEVKFSFVLVYSRKIRHSDE